MNGGFMRFLMCMILAVIVTAGLSVTAEAQPEIPPPEKQIQAAVSPAPEAMRENAEVKGYNSQGELVILREGSNELICLADNPDDDRFHAACYHKDLESFMKRGRDLRKEGKSRDEVREIRRREIEAGDIPMPQKPMALYSVTGSAGSFDYSTGSLKQAQPLYVVYIPYATEATTGISTSPASEGAPWLMDPDTPWAHIMVSTGQSIGTEEN